MIRPLEKTPARLSVGEIFFRRARPKRLRNMLEFAAEEIILPPGGPRQGLNFDPDTAPWTRDVLLEFTRGRYSRFAASGPVQDGKTLIFFSIPALYFLFEVEENVIIGCPDVALAQAIYEEKLLPVIEASKYAELLPTKGEGSKKGKVKSAVTFGNKATLRFVGAGGGDTQRSSHTARVILITEVDKMDVARASSREADPVSQMEARGEAFKDDRLVFMECTKSIEKGRINQEINELGTGHRVYISCPECDHWHAPEREHFSGWQDADDEIAAREQGRHHCPECGVGWTEAMRAEAVADPRMVAEGQRVTKKGKVVGKKPRTKTFGFQWNVMCSALKTQAQIAAREYRAEKTGKVEDEKYVTQFYWCEVCEEGRLDLVDLNLEAIYAKIGHMPKGILPAGLQELTCFIDLGLYLCWWVAIAWREEFQGSIIGYGSIEVPQERKARKIRILSALKSFRDTTLLPGWGENGISPSMTLVDSAYAQDVAYDFVWQSGQHHYRASKGYGSGPYQPSWKDIPEPPKNPKSKTPAKRKTGDNWFITRQKGGILLTNMHADHWKRRTHEGFYAAAGTPGSVELFKAERREHRAFGRQILAEREVQEFVPGKGDTTYWQVVRRANHYLDCVYGNFVARSMLLGRRKKKKPPTQQEAPTPEQLRRTIQGRVSGGIRTKY